MANKTSLGSFIFTALAAAPAFGNSDLTLATQLQARTQQLADAIAPGNRAVWDEATDPALSYISEDGDVYDKKQLLAELQPLPKGLVGSIRVIDYHLERFGSVAFARYIMDESLDYHGQLLKTKFLVSDGWVKRGHDWKLASTHLTVSLNDPKPIELPAAKLADYVGRYTLTNDIHYIVRIDDSTGTPRLTGRRDDGQESELKAEVLDVFFVSKRPRSRKIFFRDQAGLITGFGDRREGNDVLWTRER
jgi:Domain of unknown function (DUF4440)